ncbi:hypothetical protein FQR65_LT06939 [Abscondita terminalis]|nr:hypothetical protein FQR65_LT06939 [Abscondita terminalis]
MKYCVHILFIASIVNATPPKELQKCIAKTMKTVFSKNESVLYAYLDQNPFPIIDENPRIFFDAKNQIRRQSIYNSEIRNFVLHAENLQNVADVLTGIGTSRMFNNNLERKGLYLLVTNQEHLSIKIKLFWNFGLINLIVLVYDSEGTMIVLTIDPQSPGNFCQLYSKEYLTFTHCFATAPILLPKVMRKYSNCKVTYLTTITEETGNVRYYESLQFILDLLSKHFNMSLNVVNPAGKEINLDIFSMFVAHRELFPIDYVISSTFFSDTLVWIVPFPKRIPTMKILQVVFKTTVWICILVAFVLTSLTWWLVQRRTSSIVQAFMNVFSLTLFGSVNKIELFSSMRCLFLAYVVYSIHIQTAFTSKLIQILTIPQYGPRIKTLTELAESDVIIYVRNDIYRLFFNHDEPNHTLYNKIKRKLNVTTAERFSIIATNFNTYTNSSLLLTSNELEILSKIFQKDFCTIYDPVFLPIVDEIFVGKDGSYMFETLDRLIGLLMESGILSHFVDGIEYYVPIKSPKMNERKPALSLQHLYFVATLPKENPKLQKCIAKTMEKVFGKIESVLYVYVDNNRFPILQENPRVFFDARSQIRIPSTYRSYSRNYVLHVENHQNLMDALLAVGTSNLFDAKLVREGLYLLITTEEDLELKIQLSWKLGIINLIVLAYDSDGLMLVLTTDPQLPENLCGFFPKEFLTFDECFQQTSIVLPKIMRKYTNCHVKYFTIVKDVTNKVRHLESIRFLLDLLVKHLNVSLTVVNPTVSANRFDIFSMFDAYRASFPNKVFSSTFFSDTMVWIVPFPQRIPTMKILQVVFKTTVWICILVAFVLSSLTWWLVQRRTSSIVQAFMNVFSLTLFGLTNKIESFWSMRCLFLAYVVYSIHIQTGFTSKLIQTLTIPQYEPRIETLTELADSDIVIYVKQNIYDHFFDHEEPNNALYNKIKEKLNVTSASVFSDIATDYNTFTKSAVLLTRNELEILSKVFQKDFCTIHDPLFLPNLDNVFVGNEGSYMFKTLDGFISLLKESGILNHFLQGVEYYVPLKPLRKSEEKPALSLQHLYFVFVFWSAGLILSWLMWIFELIYFRRRIKFKCFL